MTFNISERYIYALNALLGLFILYFAAISVDDTIRLRLADNVVPPAASGSNARAESDGVAPRMAYQAIVERDLFNLTPATQSSAPVENENLNVTLLGTSHVSGGLRPYAIIESASGEQSLYRLGETIPDAGRLVEIGVNRVVIDHNGHRIALRIPREDSDQPDVDDEGVRPLRRFRRPYLNNPMIRRRSPAASAGQIRRVGPNAFALDRSTVNSNMQNMAQLFTEIRAVPNLQNGSAKGFRLSEIQPGSIFQNLGLLDGDVVTSVSGQPVNDPMRAMQLLSTLGTQSFITLSVIRNGAPVQLSYMIR